MQVLYCFPKGKFKVLTMSYDDGKTSDRKLVEIFNRYGIKGTFHLNSGLFGDPGRIPAKEVKELYHGHEVSAHSLTHPTIARCPKEMIAKELIADRVNLEEIVEYPVRGLSYPNGSHHQQIRELLPHLGFEYARTIDETQCFGLPEDFFRWQATCHHNHRLLELGQTFVNLYKKQYLYMMYVWGHSYEFDQDDNWDVIESFCKLTGGRDDTWYATNIEIVDYIQAVQRLKFSASMQFAFNPSSQSVWLYADNKLIEAKGGEQTTLV